MSSTAEKPARSHPQDVRTRRRARLIGIALLAGLVLWRCIPNPVPGSSLAFIFVPVAILLASLSLVQNGWSWLDHALRFRGKKLFFASITAGLLASAYLVFAAWWQGRPFMPLMHDEYAYLVQTQLLAHGRLWLPQHPLAPFFESFYILHTPVYASIEFPGTALFHVVGIWAHFPSWVMSCACAFLICSLFFAITSELLSGLWGAVGILLLLSMSWFRALSLMVMSHMVVAWLGLALALATLHWRRARRNRRWRLELLMGALAGWAAITRPIDAVALAIPVGACIGYELIKSRASFVCFARLTLTALPFIGLQLILNHGVTGHWTTTPYSYYQRLYDPQLSYFNFHPDLSLHAQSTLAQKVLLDESFLAPPAKNYTVSNAIWRFFNERIPDVASFAMPHPVLMALVPLGLWVIYRRGRWILGLGWIVYLLLYVGYAFMLPHYLVVPGPAIVLTLLCGAYALRLANRRSRFLKTAPALILIALTLPMLPELNYLRTGIPDAYRCITLVTLRNDLAAIRHRPAIVLFRFRPDEMGIAPPAIAIHEEPVYTIDAASPDESPVIRAHDLGPKNIELFQYYARLQPNRFVYIFDRADNSMHELGPVTELARRPAP